MTPTDAATLETDSPVAESPPGGDPPNYSSRNISSRAGTSVFQFIPIAQIGPSPYNTRDDFDEEQMEALTQSIVIYGVLEPVLVQDNADVPDADAFTDSPTRYRLIAGERRWRAAQRAGLEQIPCVVRKVASDLEAAEMTVSENFQRDDFSPIGEARAFQLLIRLGKKQSEIAVLANRTQGAVSKALGLNELPDAIQGLISKRLLSASHGHLLHNVYVKGPKGFGGNEDEVIGLADELVREKWTVSHLEQELKARYPKAIPPTLGLDVPTTDVAFAGPHPPSAPTAGEIVHALHTGEITESVQMAMDAQDAATAAIVARNAEDALETNQEDRLAAPIPNEAPTSPQSAALPEAGNAAKDSQADAPSDPIGDLAASDAGGDPDTAASGGDPDNGSTSDAQATGSVDAILPSTSTPSTPGRDAGAGVPAVGSNPAVGSTAPVASNVPAAAVVKAETVTPTNPAPTAPAGLPPGWINAPVKEADYVQARDMGLWPPAYAIEAVQDLKDQLSGLSDASLSDPNAITLQPVAFEAAKMMAAWNLTDPVLGPEQTVILHALYPNREETTWAMIVNVLTVSWCRRARANGAGEGAEMPEALARALTDMAAEMNS